MSLRVSKLLLRALLLLVALGLVALGLFAWLLLSGPVPVAWLTPHLERELSGDRAVVEIDQTELRLSEHQSLDLSAIGVRVRDPDGRVLSEIPRVELGLSTAAMLLERRIAVQRIEAVAPTLTLIRRADGSIGLHQEPDQVERDQAELARVLADFLASFTRGEQTSYLRSVRFTRGELVLDDRRIGRTLHARDAELSIDVLGDRARAELTFRLDQGGRAGLIQVAASHEAGQEWIGIDVAFAHLMPAPFADFVPELPFSGIRLELTGNAQTAISSAGELEPIAFDFEAQTGTVEVSQLHLGEVPVDALWVQGTLAADLQQVVVDQLSLSTDGAELSGVGEVAWRGDQPTLEADLEAENVTLDHVARLWPPHKGERARAWVLEHLDDGVVPTVRAQLRFGPGVLGQKPLPAEALAGAFSFEDLTVRYVDTMPSLVDVDGHATFTGQSMEFAVASGHVDDLVVDEGAVVITGIGIPGRDTTQLEIEAQVSGPLDQALRLIDHPPLGFTSRARLSPIAASGHVAAELRIGMPLHREFAPSDIRVAADATITDGAITADSIDITNAQLNLTVDAQTVNLSGDATVQGIPLTLQVQDRLGGNGVDRRYQVSGAPDVAQLRGLGLDLPIDLAGVVGVSATVTEGPGVPKAEIALDLTPTDIEVPQLNWRKAAGEAGALSATATIEDGALRVSGFELMSDGVHAVGSLEAQLEPFRLAQLRVDRARFGDTRAAIALIRAEPSGYHVRVDAENLDVNPWLDRQERENDRGTRETSIDEPVEIDLHAQRVVLGSAAFTEVEADLVREPDGWRSADLDGRLPGGGTFALTLTPEGEQRRLRLTSTDAGDLLQALDQTSRIEGGDLRLEATIFRQQPTLEAEGTVVTRRFRVLDAPLLARLLTVASLEGIGNLLGGQGIAFEKLEAPFALRNQVLQLGRGRLYGSQLGLTFGGWVNLATDTLDLEGTIVPLFGVNWTIGQIPIIGRLLRGSEGEGAFAMTYSVRGPASEPAVRVNPLSALAPGFLRELFSGLREGTLQAPEMLPSNDR